MPILVNTDDAPIAITISGAQGPAGSDASVTNANVNAAIETDAAATRTSLGLGTAALEDVEAFAAASHTHVSAEITDATHLATPNTVVKRNATGAAYFGDVAGDVGSFQSAQIAGNLTALGNGSIGGSFQAGFGGFQVTDTGVTSAANLSGTNTGDQTSIVGIGGTMAQFDTACADGVFVFQSSALGTPSSGTLTNCAGLPISTGVSGLASGIATFLATPTSANLAAAVTDENGSGKLLFANGTISIASGKTATINNTITWTGTDGTTITLPSTSATMARTDTGQTFAGNNTYSGQIQLTGQAATDANSAMTRGLMDTRRLFISAYTWARSSAGYTTNHAGTGSILNEDDTMSLRTGATAGSVSAIRSGSAIVRNWNRSGGFRAVVNWSLRTAHKVRIINFDTSGSDTVVRCLLGQGCTITAIQDWQASDKGIGFKIINSVLWAHVANGSAVTTTSSGQTLTGFISYDIMIESDGSGGWTLYLNGSSVATGSGAPTGNSAASSNGMQFNVSNGTTAAQRYVNLIEQESFQF